MPASCGFLAIYWKVSEMKQKCIAVVAAAVFLSLSLTGLSSASSADKEETKWAVEEASTQSPALQHYGATNSLSVAAQGLDEAVGYKITEATNRWNEAEAQNARRAAIHKKKIPKDSIPSIGTGRCGGNLPPCWVMERESKGDLNAYNPTGCGGRGCYGKWQCDPRSCSGHGTEEEQDAEAAALWDGGAGCSNWAACG